MSATEHGMRSGGIRFGTDGWRDVIAEGFTFERVRLVSAAIARHLVETEDARRRGVAIGYDARFLSDRFATAVAEVMAGEGIPVLFSRRVAPTPALAVAVVERGLAGGVVVTASHNPPEFNGLKIKPPYGGSATESVTRPIEELANGMLARGEHARAVPYREGLASGRIVEFDPVAPYLDGVLAQVDRDAIERAGLAVACDPMHGAARGVLAEALARAGCRPVESIREEANPGFGGLNPEPIAVNMGPLVSFVSSSGAFRAGFAVDGDGDRIGAVDERGRFVNAHQIFALILRHLVRDRGWRGEVVKTVSTTSMIDHLAQRYDLPLVETPVGFKYVCARMLESDVLIGGEESGGIGVRGHIPERDGVLSALLLAETMAVSGEGLGALVARLEEEVGPHRYGRIDVAVQDESQRARMARWASEVDLDAVAGVPVLRTKRIDGVKLVLEDGSWIMVRPSGTEPLVRIYAEAPDVSRLERLLGQGREWVAKETGLRLAHVPAGDGR